MNCLPMSPISPSGTSCSRTSVTSKTGLSASSPQEKKKHAYDGILGIAIALAPTLIPKTLYRAKDIFFKG
ncbi:MAG: hypothetical protein HUK20_12970 [Fibrobacter sp.]|nr:hypothetical protein [Fibrobacter sp.]